MKPLHDKKHTLAKRGLSLLCVLALCLGLLPTTALAVDAPENLYVGDQVCRSEISCWTTNSETGELTEYKDGGNDWNVKYDPSTATLTLKNATIKTTATYSQGAVIYAHSVVGSAVSLTIQLEGKNTIECASAPFGIYVNAEMSNDSYGTDASLTITGNGSLEVSGSSHGIFVKSGTGNASINIKNVAVTSSTNGNSAAGVYVHSGATATNSPQLSLAVNGGSLTASGTESSDGIQFYVGSSLASNATTSLTVSENAIVDARNGGIKATRVSTVLPTPTPTGENSSGIVFDGSAGTVYGNVTLQKDLEISEGETLTVGKGASLTVPSGTTLTNNGTIDNSGTLTNNGTVDNSGTLNVKEGGELKGETPTGGTVVSAPTITAQPAATTVTEGQSATFTVTATGGNLSYQWQQITDNDQSWTEIPGATGDSYTTDAATLAMNNYQYQCVVSNSAGSVTSDAATLTVNAATVPVTGVSLDKDTLSLYTGDTATLTATVAPDTATNKTVTWESSNTEVATVDANGKVTAEGEGETTITVKTADGGKTDTCTVTVTDKTYTISADATVLNFGSAYTGYAQPAAQTVTITNSGNQTVTLTQPTANNFEITTSDSLTLAPNATASFTIQPKDKLPRGSYSEQITISGNDGASATLTASFTVKEPPYTGKYSYEVSTSVGDHGSLTVDRYATEGDKVTIDVTPDQAYKLDELVVTANGKDVELTANSDGTFSFTMPSADVRITATFAEDPDWTEPEEPATDVSDLFIDIAPDAWYKDAVQYAYDNGLMTGVSATEFAPEATTTRAMIVSILARLENVTTAEAAGFADVDDNDWYATAVNWAANVGVVNGYEDNTFKPNTAITREQLAAILMNYAAYKGEDVSNRADLTSYTDQPSTWAEEAMSWAVAEGLISGVTADTLQPQGAATRAQVAAILQRFLSE